MSLVPYQITFVALVAALVALRVTFHVRARIHEPGIENPPEGAAVPWIRPLVMPVWLGLTVPWLFAPDRIAWALVPFSPAVRWSGAGLVVLGLALLAWVHVALDRNFSPMLRIRADHTMITHGPYRWVRHPMYTAFLMLMGGYFLLTGHVLLFLTALGMLVTILAVRTPREEAMLVGRFGDAYRAYMARTGALLPRFT